MCFCNTITAAAAAAATDFDNVFTASLPFSVDFNFSVVSNIITAAAAAAAAAARR